MKTKRLFSGWVFLLMLLVVVTSCSDDAGEKGRMPELPPAESLVMNFDVFIDDPADESALKAAHSYQNAIYSYISVSFWNVMIAAPTAIPVMVYLEAFNHTPEYLGDNAWQWSYSLSEGEEAYSARLVAARISNEEFTARMFISKEGAYQDFKWFDGTIRYDHTHAEWTMYESSDNAKPWLNIEWNRDWEADTADITYEVVKAGDKEAGSFITFGTTLDEVYDAYYHISLSDKETLIKWNTETNVGTVQDEAHFGDANWHCWNELFQNVDCN